MASISILSIGVLMSPSAFIISVPFREVFKGTLVEDNSAVQLMVPLITIFTVPSGWSVDDTTTSSVVGVISVVEVAANVVVVMGNFFVVNIVVVVELVSGFLVELKGGGSFVFLLTLVVVIGSFFVAGIDGVFFTVLKLVDMILVEVSGSTILSV